MMNYKFQGLIKNTSSSSVLLLIFEILERKNRARRITKQTNY